LQRGEADKAAEAFTKALKWDPNFIQAQASLAAAKYMLGELDESIALSEKVVAKEPAFGPAYNNLAIAWLEKGDGKKALEYAKLAAANGFDVTDDFWAELEKYK
jgi:tetratricopeptide (TPR) repeat protein